MLQARWPSAHCCLSQHQHLYLLLCRRYTPSNPGALSHLSFKALQQRRVLEPTPSAAPSQKHSPQHPLRTLHFTATPAGYNPGHPLRSATFPPTLPLTSTFPTNRTVRMPHSPAPGPGAEEAEGAGAAATSTRRARGRGQGESSEEEEEQEEEEVRGKGKGRRKGKGGVVSTADEPKARGKGGKVPEPKSCSVCGREITWRKKWERCWEEVKYCSVKCRGSKGTLNKGYEDRILEILQGRDAGKTMCPSEVLPEEQKQDKAIMEEVRQAARRLVHRGLIEITQKGQVVEPSAFRGPIRLRLVTK